MTHPTGMHYRDSGMKRAFRPRTRRRLSWLVALLLLWQQVAMAAYACGAVPAAVGAAAAAAHTSAMARMGDGCEGMAAPAADPLCRPHCQPDHATQADMRTASVPFSTLAMLPPEVLSIAIVALPSERSLIRRNRFCAPPLVPPRLLFCSLLI